MNHIRYVEYNAAHSGDFIFDLPGGHDCWLLLLTHTPALFEVQGTLTEYPEKCSVLFAPGQKIYYRAAGGRYENDWLRFESDETYVSGFPSMGVPFSVPAPDYIHNLFQLLAWENFLPSRNHDAFIDQFLRVLFSKLSEAASLDAACPHQWELLELRRAIYNRPQLNWTVPDMARQLHLSTGYLQMIYKKTFQISCMDDVIRGRIRRATDMLRCTDHTIKETAESCGYNNVEHFCRQFKKITGKTPRTYRNSVVPRHSAAKPL